MAFRFLAAATAAVAFAFSYSAVAQTAPAASAPAAAAAPAPATAKPAPAAAPEKAAMSDAMEGKMAYYGKKFNGRKTASGERFNSGAMTMAHKTLPFGTKVKVTNIKNNKSVVVRVNDRGPSTPDRIGDLTSGAASKIGMIRSGVIDTKLEVVGQPKARMAKKAKMAKKG